MGYIFEAMQRKSRGGDDAARWGRAKPAPEDGGGHAESPPTPTADAPAGHSLLSAAMTVTTAAPAATTTEPTEENTLASSDRGVARTLVPPKDDRLVALTEPAGVMAEEYRSIRTGLLAKWQHRRHLVHTITSATPQEGKTITSLNLGLSLAELRNRRTVVVEADLRLPQFGRLPEGPGLIQVLEGQAELDDAICRVQDSGLDVIGAGGYAHDQAVQLLSGAPMAGVLDELRKRYDHVVIDTPPVIELADAGILGAMSDDVLLIVRMNRTPKPLVDQAIRILDSYNAPVAGLIGTDHQRTGRRYYYRYGYGSRYHYRYRKAA
jgi:capsular exopolysaccharide synthesis family protein